MTAREGMSDLRERCVELREWHETGLLRDGKLRQLASSMTQFPADRRLTLAERQTEMEALDYVISTPAVFDMDSAVEAVCAVWNLHAPDARRIITTALPHLMPDMEALRRDVERYRVALEKIADWHGAWGPYPEKNENWRAMAVVTAREAIPNVALAAQRDTSEGGG